MWFQTKGCQTVFQFPLLEPGKVRESSAGNGVGGSIRKRTLRRVYYQKCLQEYNRHQGEREDELKRLRQQLQELEQRIENATEVLM